MIPPLYPISRFQSQCTSLRHAGGNACAFRYAARRWPHAPLHLQAGRALPGHPQFLARPQLLTGPSSTPSCLSPQLGVLLQRRSDAVRSMLAAGPCEARYAEGCRESCLLGRVYGLQTCIGVARLLGFQIETVHVALPLCQGASSVPPGDLVAPLSVSRRRGEKGRAPRNMAGCCLFQAAG
jgi:hypothetical protein